MAECNICGANTQLVKAEVSGTILKVCSNCAKSGKTIDEPQKYKEIKSKNNFYKTPTTNQRVMDKLAYRSLSMGAETILVNNFGKVVRSAREEMGLKQEELARKINEHLSVIHAVETQKRRPGEKLAKKLEKFLRIKLYENIE